ncbi:MAG: mechanosensitive ion channel, partial [Nitrospinaceae bacterium]|nr:mechanosensitive ion channel [Nitrospinaceae bacterium]
LIATLAEIIITVALAILFIEGAHAAVEYFLNGRRDHQGSVIEPSPHQRTLLPLAYSAVKWVVIAVAGIILLASLGVNIAPVLAGAGILGLAIGFGAQSLVKDIITGVFMLIENNIAIGDIVRVKDIGGTVESFSLRSVKLRDYDGNVHVIPNSVIDVVTNFTKEYSRAVFEVGVAYREDADRVMGVIRQVGDEMAQDPEWGDQILEPVEIAGLERFDDSAIVIRGRFKTKPIKQWGVRREFNRRIKIAFDAMSIEIPFPYRTLTWAQEAPEPPEGSTIPPTPIATRGTGDADGDSD